MFLPEFLFDCYVYLVLTFLGPGNGKLTWEGFTGPHLSISDLSQEVIRRLSHEIWRDQSEGLRHSSVNLSGGYL